MVEMAKTGVTAESESMASMAETVEQEHLVPIRCSDRKYRSMAIAVFRFLLG